MIQALPQENNQKQMGQKMQNQASTTFKERILQANMTHASASAAAFVAEGKTSPNLTASAINF